MENPIKMDDLGGNTPIFGNTHMFFVWESWIDVFLMGSGRSGDFENKWCIVREMPLVQMVFYLIVSQYSW